MVEPATTTEHGAGARPRIVMGFDGSAPSAEALQWAARQADCTGSTLQILTTWEWPSSYGWALSLPADYSPANDAQATLDEAAERIRREHPSLPVETVLIEGRPGLSLVEASTGAALLVVGSRGHGSFSGVVLGSVSQYCVTRAHCPVLVYRDSHQHKD